MTTARTVPVTTEMGGEERDAEDAWHVVRRLGVRRLLVDAFVRFRYGDGFSSSRALALQAARHRQPGLSWLALGAAVAVLISFASTGLLAVHVSQSPSFGDVYGPLAGVVALLLWSLLVSVALFYGTAVCAQLEAVRAGHPDPAYDDPGRPHDVSVD